MFKGLFRLGMLVMTGRFLKQRLRGLLLLLGFWLLLWFLHSEYLSYVEISQDTRYIMSVSILKVSLILLSLISYVFFVEIRIVKNIPGKVPLSPLRASSNNLPVPSGNIRTGGDDGFEFLRYKKVLKTESEKILGK